MERTCCPFEDEPEDCSTINRQNAFSQQQQQQRGEEKEEEEKGEKEEEVV